MKKKRRPWEVNVWKVWITSSDLVQKESENIQESRAAEEGSRLVALDSMMHKVDKTCSGLSALPVGPIACLLFFVA